MAQKAKREPFTLKDLERFIRLRNKSEYASNLQWQIDANTCGFSTDDLGDVRKVDAGNGGFNYEWDTPYGVLVEKTWGLNPRVSLRTLAEISAENARLQRELIKRQSEGLR